MLITYRSERLIDLKGEEWLVCIDSKDKYGMLQLNGK